MKTESPHDDALDFSGKIAIDENKIPKAKKP